MSTVGARRDAADLQQRLGGITSPHGVARNNHRCLSAGVEPASSLDLVIRTWYVRSRTSRSVTVSLFVFFKYEFSKLDLRRLITETMCICVGLAYREVDLKI